MDIAPSSRPALPPIQSDLAAACADFDIDRIALMEDVFSASDIEEARAAVLNLAHAELAEGSALIPPGWSNQRVYGLIYKAPVFRRIASNPTLLALAHHILGPRMTLYSVQAHIVPPGGEMDPHFDQLEFSPFVPFPIVAAAVVMLDDFTAENGATQMGVGCEAKGLEDVAPVDRMVPLLGPKGTLAAYGGLLWHSTGINKVATARLGLLIHFCLPWVRQFENYQRTISTSVANDMPEELRDLLGIHDKIMGRRWHTADNYTSTWQPTAASQN